MAQKQVFLGCSKIDRNTADSIFLDLIDADFDPFMLEDIPKREIDERLKSTERIFLCISQNSMNDGVLDFDLSSLLEVCQEHPFIWLNIDGVKIPDNFMGHPSVSYDKNNIHDMNLKLKKDIYKSENDIFQRENLFPGYRELKERIRNEDRQVSIQCATIFDSVINLLEMMLLIFNIYTIRCYEDQILNEPESHRKKVKSLKETVFYRLNAPSLGMLFKLSKSCFHLINAQDENIPEPLLKMKDCLNKDIELKSLSIMMNDLESLIDSMDIQDTMRGKKVYRPEMQQSMLRSILPRFVEYRNTLKHLQDLSVLIEDKSDSFKVDLRAWHQALEVLAQGCTPMFTHEFVHKTVAGIQPNEDGFIEDGKQNLSYVLKTKAYINGRINKATENLSYAEFDDLQESQSQNFYGIRTKQGDKEWVINLFPFLIIRDDLLFYFKKSKAKGYEYYSLGAHATVIINTKTKFSHSIFNLGTKGDRQAFFWTEVTPHWNKAKTIKANIPTTGIENFVGRKKQMKKIVEEILEIPNRDGIIYGPGGVGKTLLMQKLSMEIFEESNLCENLFKNIIWVSAKRNYYNPLLDEIREQKQQFESLDHIFSAILLFFDYQSVEEYTINEKREFVLEILEDNKVLLVLDNFETIQKSEIDRIIRFFDIDVKKHLRDKPSNFKFIITSREQIPCGFHPIQLEGLALTEAKQLMKLLYAPYKDFQTELTDDQKKQLHQVTSGVPIVLIHCFGQIFEYNRTFQMVIAGLSKASNELIKFSFSEILGRLKRDKLKLKILILLERFNHPLMVRQIADILDENEYDIHNKIPELLNFQCIDRICPGNEEKFSINDEVILFTKSLSQDFKEITNEIHENIIERFSLDKQMDYTTEEQEIIRLFNDMLTNDSYLEAESFIKNQLKEKPDSIFLKYHYAKFLKNQKREVQSAIKILEKIAESDTKHPIILRLLVSCFTCLDVPKYDSANVYVNELRSILYQNKDEDLQLELAEFYVGWSNSIRLHKNLSDPIREMERRVKFKELAQAAVDILGRRVPETQKDRYYYLNAHAHFNVLEYDEAIRLIDNAINLLENNPHKIESYNRLRQAIVKDMNRTQTSRR